ncbi:putative transcription factor GRF family [Helianthus debilis subsp. tardiflorus]
MSSSSTSVVIRKPKVFKVDLDGNLYCHNDVVAVLRVAGRKSERHGQEFYGCSQWPRGDCKFFLWKEDVDKMFISELPLEWTAGLPLEWTALLPF